jgi:hypothetical protein
MSCKCNAVGCQLPVPIPQPVEGEPVNRADLGSCATTDHALSLPIKQATMSELRRISVQLEQSIESLEGSDVVKRLVDARK